MPRVNPTNHVTEIRGYYAYHARERVWLIDDSKLGWTQSWKSLSQILPGYANCWGILNPGEDMFKWFKELADRINKYGQAPPAFVSAFKSPIKQAVVGPSHMAFLLEDGRVCRISFFILADRMDSSKGDNGKGGKGSGGSGNNAARQSSRTRNRVIRTSTLRQSGSSARSAAGVLGASGVIMGTSRPVYVPDELVSQAQVVLQGKSRSVIIRELQRTNLDVNLAVNNLLSRDDEESEDVDDSQDSYVPEDLISLLDPGGAASFHAESGGTGAGPSVIIDADAMFSEDMFGYTSSLRNRNTRPRTDRDAAGSSERENAGMLRWRDRQYFGPRRWLESALRDSGWYDREPSASKPVENKIPPKRTEPSNVSPLWWSDDVEFWPERGYPTPVRFSAIAALSSELVAVSNAGQIYQWRWSEPEPYRQPDNTSIHHPKTSSLMLTWEKVVQISACQIRATVLTESGRIATWLDDSVTHAPGASRLEHAATLFPEFTGIKISHIYTSSLFTVAKLENEELFWWGVLPFSHRRRLWERYKSKAKKHGGNSGGEITANSVVCMKNGPLYHAGAVGFSVVNGVPKVGQLLGSVWNLTDTCRFKVIPAPPPPPVAPLPPAEKRTSSSERFPQDKTDMPPPPSPASSTCSEASFAGSYKRKKTKANRESDAVEEETWPIKDVVFVEDVKNVPVGKVVKVDGMYAAVKFPSKEQKESDDPLSLLQECRLMRKDELQIVKSGGQSRIPDCFYKYPRRINSMERGQVIALAIDSNGLHTVVRDRNKFSYVIYDLNSGKVEQENPLPTDAAAFVGQDIKNISIHILGEDNMPLLIDGNGAIYPLARDNTESIKDPQLLDLPPVKGLAFGSQLLHGSSSGSPKTHAALALIVLQNQILMPRILACDIDGVNSALQLMEHNPRLLQGVLNERCDGGRNILHACISLCSPSSNKDLDVENPTATPSAPSVATGDSLEALGSRGISLREMMRRAASGTTRQPAAPVPDREPDNQPLPPAEETIPTFSWPPEPSSAIPLPGEEEIGVKAPVTGNCVSEPHKRRANALASLRAVCDAAVMVPHLRQLLSMKDSSGNTPFMQAVSVRAYPAALLILDTAERLANNSLSTDLASSEARRNILQSLIYPLGKSGCSADDSPLYVLCSNDTCSFTWTGAEHINQDIFECRTCGLTGSLCCCSECARVCHKGHDCKLKRTSPTAYCDCWEKCKCKALIAGNQTARYGLLCRLISDTDLVTLPNSRGENVLLFLVQTVGRQLTEQRQYRPSRSRGSRKIPLGEADPEMPDHDLEPPRFAKRALERLLGDWTAVSAMLKSGMKEEVTSTASSIADDATYLQSQSGSSQLDKFTHCLLVKCPVELLDVLLNTLIRELQKAMKLAQKEEAKSVVRRFIRSVVRVFVVYSVEMAPVAGKKKASSFGVSQPLVKCRRVFQSLAALSVEALCEAADSLIAPVRMGVSRPTLPFPLASSNAEAIQGSEELFSIDPVQVPHSESEAGSDAETSMVEPRRGPAPDVPDIRQDMHDDMEHMEVEDHDASDHEDGVDRGDEEDVGGDRQRGNDSDMDLDLLAAETESESEDGDNQSTHTQDNASIQRSVQTGATAGSDAGTGVASLALFSEDDSAESSAQESEESDNADSDDNNDEDPMLADEQLERRAPNTTLRSTLAPSIQWAVRTTRQEAGSGSAAVPANPPPSATSRSAGASGLIYMDPLTIRRPAAPVAAVSQEPTSSASAVCLSRAFGLVIRQIAETLSSLQDCTFDSTACGVRTLDLSYQESLSLQDFLESRLRTTWDWLVSIMDSTEAQLRFGTVLSNVAGLSASAQFRGTRTRIQSTSSTGLPAVGVPTRDPPADPLSARRDFLSYCLSLMRAHTSEHADALPVLDVSSLKHIAYVFDALVYFMRSGTDMPQSGAAEPATDELGVESWMEQDENENADLDDEVSNAFENEEDDQRGKKHPFFRRSESTLCLGCAAQDPIKTPLNEALPLAEQPHLLHPGGRREEMFGMPMQAVSYSGSEPGSIAFDSAPVKLGLSMKSREKGEAVVTTPNRPPPPYPGSSAEIDRAKEDNVSKFGADRQSTPLSAEEPSAVSSAVSTSSPARAPIIVSPRKITSTPPASAERPPLKSVIVRAGSSQPQSESPKIVNLGSSSDGQPPGTTSQSDAAMVTEEPSAAPPLAQEVSAHVTVETSRPVQKPLFPSAFGKGVPSDMLLGRWRLTLDLFGRVFVEDVGAEPGSVIADLGGFPVKESRFRRDMERIRNAQQRDVQLLKLERDRSSLLIQTFKELNTQYNNNYRRSTPTQPPLAVTRVKVTFKDEPGEGSGVARSFYTVICEALLSPEAMPSLDAAQVGPNAKNSFSIVKKKNRQGGTGDSTRKLSTIKFRRTLNPEARAFNPGESLVAGSDPLGEHISHLGEQLYSRILTLRPSQAAKITGMLLELPTPQILVLLASEEGLRMRVEEAHDILAIPARRQSTSEPSRDATAESSALDLDVFNLSNYCKKPTEDDDERLDDSAPLFFMPGKRGFYSPRQEKASADRLNAFRNVGRLIGLCLLQNELCPLPLNRHVLKAILGRPIRFHDLAFYDPVMYESLRKMLLDAEVTDDSDPVAALALTFGVDLSPEEGGGSYPLIPGGANVPVTSQNAFSYVRRYAQYRLVKTQAKALEAIRSGVLDVIPSSTLEGLTAEDLRLLLNGVGDINVQTLISYTSFNDESGESAERLLRFKKWFWAVVEKMTSRERQDLVYFWTGSPALPASEEGFQPMPSITVRPADDFHLPTANTCISRLYVPMYSSRTVLKSKLLLAIRTKNFGFV